MLYEYQPVLPIPDPREWLRQHYIISSTRIAKTPHHSSQPLRSKQLQTLTHLKQLQHLINQQLQLYVIPRTNHPLPTLRSNPPATSDPKHRLPPSFVSKKLANRSLPITQSHPKPPPEELRIRPPPTPLPIIPKRQ
ncbi:uncharacterized protein TrAtP1_005381 [Trichoderma atroviride]|uniref:uncharacterized protein n=1 Tax=Hypocrea atroviridis TaxID=63577 RepID=UPI00332AC81E|nr:hypothetical protein TrAtP1_005381 [Trichoderma atroviride]